MNRLICRLVLIVSVLTTSVIGVQAQILSAAQDAVNNFYSNTAKEKLFVHTDKSLYLPGELLWFKVYALENRNSSAAGQSKIVYVDVVDKDNRPLLRSKIAMDQGKGNGSLYIPVTAATGTYHLRAYTNWMKNFSADAFFEKELSIVNPSRSPEAQQTASNTYDLQFFPEGGNMIEGIAGKVAFKATGNDGAGISVRGVIINNLSDTVARFETLKFGMGQFSLKPVAGQTYSAIVRTAQNDLRVAPLPPAKKEGYTLAVADNNGNIVASVHKAGSGTDNIYLVVHNGKKVSQAVTGSLNNGSAEFNIDKSKLSDGVSQFTIFDERGRPLSERLYFKRAAQKLVLDAIADADAYTTRKKVNVNVFAKDESNKTQQTDLSVSVYRVDSLQTSESIDIVNYMWLTSDLKGNIEAPEYYFSADNPITNEALDNLMLTQGWRRFKWDSALQKEKQQIKYLPELNGHLIAGKITQQDGSPANEIIAYMGVPGKRMQYYAAISDSTGRFSFNTKDFYGPNEIIVQTNYERDSIYNLEVESPFAEKFSNTPMSQFSFLPAMAGALQAHNLSAQVQNVYAGIKNRQFFKPNADSTAFYGTPTKTYVLDSYVRFPTMDDILREYVNPVNIVKRQNRYHLRVTDKIGAFESDPLVLLDGVPYFNIDRIMGMDPLKIERLEVVTGRSFYGPTVAEGILSFTTPTHDLNGLAIDPHAIVLDYEGMQLQREFYSPVYDSAEASTSRLPDFRNVLYWSPDLFTDTNGKGKFDFYTSDQPGTYVGVIQGITANGIPGSKYFKFQVK